MIMIPNAKWEVHRATWARNERLPLHLTSRGREDWHQIVYPLIHSLDHFRQNFWAQAELTQEIPWQQWYARAALLRFASTLLH